MGIITEQDIAWMQHALLLADKAAELGEVPVGAVVVQNDVIIGEGFNQPIGLHDPTAHAEIQALRAAGQLLGNYRLPDADLYVTLEPCSMCAGAMVHARIRRVIFAATEPKAGVVCSQAEFFQQDFLNHKVEVIGGVLAQQASEKLQNFFRERRKKFGS
jgi:tRNA(adenine34) deaminase